MVEWGRGWTRTQFWAQAKRPNWAVLGLEVELNIGRTWRNWAHWPAALPQVGPNADKQKVGNTWKYQQSIRFQHVPQVGSVARAEEVVPTARDVSGLLGLTCHSFQFRTFGYALHQPGLLLRRTREIFLPFSCDAYSCSDWVTIPGCFCFVWIRYACTLYMEVS